MNEEIQLTICIILWYFPNIFLHMIKSIVKIFIPTVPKNVKDQLALVTGGANGLGRYLCFELAKKGCNVAIVDLDMKNAEETVQILKGFDVKSKAFKADVSKINEVEQLKEDIERDLDTVDKQKNNACIYALYYFVKE